jgi:hypothetical protein
VVWTRGGALLEPPSKAAAAKTRTLVCASCGYGISIRGDEPSCPMCQGTDWEPGPWRPFTTLDEVTIVRARTVARRAVTED